jgi:hypothetical protein
MSLQKYSKLIGAAQFVFALLQSNDYLTLLLELKLVKNETQKLLEEVMNYLKNS